MGPTGMPEFNWSQNRIHAGVQNQIKTFIYLTMTRGKIYMNYLNHTNVDWRTYDLILYTPYITTIMTEAKTFKCLWDPLSQSYEICRKTLLPFKKF